MQTLKMEIESCPCRICRSDLAYISVCESPIEIMTVMEIIDLCPLNDSPARKGYDASKKPVRTPTSRRHGNRAKEASSVSKRSPFKIDEGVGVTNNP